MCVASRSNEEGHSCKHPPRVHTFRSHRLPERWATVGRLRLSLVMDDAGGGLPELLRHGAGIIDRQRSDSSDQGKATESRAPQSMVMAPEQLQGVSLTPRSVGAMKSVRDA